MHRKDIQNHNLRPNQFPSLFPSWQLLFFGDLQKIIFKPHWQKKIEKIDPFHINDVWYFINGDVVWILSSIS